MHQTEKVVQQLNTLIPHEEMAMYRIEMVSHRAGMSMHHAETTLHRLEIRSHRVDIIIPHHDDAMHHPETFIHRQIWENFDKTRKTNRNKKVDFFFLFLYIKYTNHIAPGDGAPNGLSGLVSETG